MGAPITNARVIGTDKFRDQLEEGAREEVN